MMWLHISFVIDMIALFILIMIFCMCLPDWIKALQKKDFKINIGPKKKDPIKDLEKMMNDLDEDNKEELKQFVEKLRNR